MATKYGLAVSSAFVKGTAGPSLESMRRNYTKDKLIDVACSLGWFIRDTMGTDTFKACLNLVESSPACGGGLERLAKAYKQDRLGPYRGGPINAAKISSEEFVAHMAKFGLNSYGEPLDEEEEAAAAAAALAASSQQRQQLLTQQQQQQQHLQGQSQDQDPPVFSLFDPDETPALPPGQPQGGAPSDGVVDDGSSGNNNGDMGAAGQALDKTTADDRKKLCRHVWRGDVCRDWTCDKAHPPRCVDPMCYPKRRSNCQHWHRRSVQQPSQPSSQPSQPLQQHHRRQQKQGNGRGAGPGRAGRPQPQGKGIKPGGQGQWQQQRQQRQQQQRHTCQRQQGRQQQQGRWPPPPPPAPPPPPPLFPRQGWQQQQQQWQDSSPRMTYRDVVKGVATGRHVPVQDLLLDRLASLEERLAMLTGPYRS